ncbi:MAG: FemAB family PEP-CTERM system-associated protein [Deltaproteobacteria bacterium]|nr:FemAB family PEP-CTERM system-associated protein [Deltaproteobacteria bacterium]
MSPDLQVTEFAGDRAEWDGFVDASPHGTFFHLLGWRDVLQAAFGFRAHYLAARRGGELVGVLPLCAVPLGLRAHALLSLPFAIEAGVCAADGAAHRALDAAAVALAAARGATYLELRDGVDADQRFRVREGLYFRFRRPLHATDEENFAAIPRKQRRMVRVGQRAGLRADSETPRVEVLHDLYARSVRRLGTPVFPLAYFRLLMRTFPERSAVLTVSAGGRPVAAVLSFLFRDTIMPYYAGSRRESFRQAANDFMYWELMRYARRRGARRFDFGRSKLGTGAFAFKRHWGFEPEALRYRVHARDGGALVERRIDDPGVRVLRWGWRHLPLACTKRLGPVLLRRFGAAYT